MGEKAQISVEYLIVVGFVTFIVVGILGIAFFYAGSIQDRIKMTQLINFANKVTSTAESVYYAGQPSKATISAYLPENVKSILIFENSLIFEIETSSGLNKISFTSNVPIEGTLSQSSGLKKIKLVAQEEHVAISQ